MPIDNYRLTFSTINGNQYCYDDMTGVVYHLPENGNRPESLSNINEPEYSRLAIKVDNNTIDKALQTVGYTELILNVTENCNLRCKYCAFSGNYTLNRTHSNSYMDQDVAEKALTDYHRGCSIAKEKSAGLTPGIGLYGGEPTLAFNLIKNVMPKIRRLFGKNVLITLTTNGTTLNQEMIDFFIDNEINLAFSLNGGWKEHDRLRVFADGTGSFEKAWHNIQKVRFANPNFYKDRCSILVNYDFGTDMYELYRFFSTKIHLLPNQYIFSPISPAFTDWYSKYSKESRDRFFQSIDFLHNLYFEKLLEGKSLRILGSMVGPSYKALINRIKKNTFQPAVLPLTATCVPGTKMFVSTDGTYHMCERINHHFPIGYAGSGLDLDAICTIIAAYRNQIYSECFNCPVKRLCHVCMATLAGEGVFERNPTNTCETNIHEVTNNLTRLYSFLEMGLPESAILADQSPIISGKKV